MCFCDWVDDIRRFPKSYRCPPTRSVDEICFLVVAGQEGYGRRHAIRFGQSGRSVFM